MVILDDAFQHRPVKATKNIVLTAYGQLFTDDWLLPVGRLRDVVSRVQQADTLTLNFLLPHEAITIAIQIITAIESRLRVVVFIILFV